MLHSGPVSWWGHQACSSIQGDASDPSPRPAGPPAGTPPPPKRGQRQATGAGSRVLCEVRCGLGRALPAFPLPLSHPFPLTPVSFLGFSHADGRPTPVWLAHSTPEQRGAGQASHLVPQGGSSLGWNPGSPGASVGPREVVFTLDFLYLSDLGSLMTVKMKLVRRCELTASCRRQTDYLQPQPTSPVEPNKGAILTHLDEQDRQGAEQAALAHCWAAPTQPAPVLWGAMSTCSGVCAPLAPLLQRRPLPSAHGAAFVSIAVSSHTFPKERGSGVGG